MNLLTIFSLYPDQEACIEHLEVRWGDCPSCPHCGSASVSRKADALELPRLQIVIRHDLRKDEWLQKWFLAVGLVVNAKKSLSSYQLARDLDLNQKTAWSARDRGS